MDFRERDKLQKSRLYRAHNLAISVFLVDRERVYKINEELLEMARLLFTRVTY